VLWFWNKFYWGFYFIIINLLYCYRLPDLSCCVLQFYVSHFHALQFGPSFSRLAFSLPAILTVCHFHVLHFQSTLTDADSDLHVYGSQQGLNLCLPDNTPLPLPLSHNCCLEENKNEKFKIIKHLDTRKINHFMCKLKYWHMVRLYTFSLPISTFSALGVSHVMHYINLCYLLTYLLTYFTCCQYSALMTLCDFDLWFMLGFPIVVPGDDAGHFCRDGLVWQRDWQSVSDVSHWSVQ